MLKGMLWKTQERHVFECPKCKLKINRRKVVSINIRRRYLEGKRREKRKPNMQGIPTAMNRRNL
jgi:transposase